MTGVRRWYEDVLGGAVVGEGFCHGANGHFVLVWTTAHVVQAASLLGIAARNIARRQARELDHARMGLVEEEYPLEAVKSMATITDISHPPDT
jgi:hypothetical protein